VLHWAGGPGKSPEDSIYLSPSGNGPPELASFAQGRGIATGWQNILARGKPPDRRPTSSRCCWAGIVRSYLSAPSSILIGLVPDVPVPAGGVRGQRGREGRKMRFFSPAAEPGRAPLALLEEVRYGPSSPTAPTSTTAFVEQLAFPGRVMPTTPGSGPWGSGVNPPGPIRAPRGAECPPLGQKSASGFRIVRLRGAWPGQCPGDRVPLAAAAVRPLPAVACTPAASRSIFEANGPVVAAPCFRHVRRRWPLRDCGTYGGALDELCPGYRVRRLARAATATTFRRAPRGVGGDVSRRKPGTYVSPTSLAQLSNRSRCWGPEPGLGPVPGAWWGDYSGHYRRLVLLAQGAHHGPLVVRGGRLAGCSALPLTRGRGRRVPRGGSGPSPRWCRKEGPLTALD